jgi:hypothetical protein
MKLAIHNNKELETQGLGFVQDMPAKRYLAAEAPTTSTHEMRGPYQLESGAIYEGEWKGEMRDGNGK